MNLVPRVPFGQLKGATPKAVDEIQQVTGIAVVPLEFIKAVAHIGADWGYGQYELEQEHIDFARKIYEEAEQ